MPGKGKSVERTPTPEEDAGRTAETQACPGETTRDAHATRTCNGVAYWRNIPARVWDYTVGGYQLLKKWLSHREAPLLGRDLTPDEAQEVKATARRIAALRLLESALDVNYQAVKATGFAWGEGPSV